MLERQRDRHPELIEYAFVFVLLTDNVCVLCILGIETGDVDFVYKKRKKRKKLYLC